MIGQGYREKRTVVLDIWKRYQTYRGEEEDGIDPDFLTQRVKAIEEGKYILAVVGETKAGKSTLINALLGEQILPTDVLQSSSAIVEIFKSDKKYVEVKYADGLDPVRVYDNPNTPDIDEAFEHLRRIGSLNERYRSIPTTLIDSYIVQKRIQPGQQLPIEDMQAASKLQLKDKESLIKEYVESRSLSDIPVEINFGFPLKFAFDEFRLVDSPGVNAVGGVQDRTFEYLHNANAVLFVHSIEGPIENSSFRDFITKIIPNRTRDSLFLVLSKSGLKSEIEIESKVNEARSMFKEIFDPERVLHVDSLLKAVCDDTERFDSAQELKSHYLERRKYFKEKNDKEPRADWRDGATKYDSKVKLLSNTLDDVEPDADFDSIREVLGLRSNFELMEKAISELSMRAPEQQLAELLKAVKLGYANQVSAYEQNIGLLTKKCKAPQIFANEITAIQKLNESYQLRMDEFSEEMKQKYSGVNATYRHRLTQLKDIYLEELKCDKEDWILKELGKSGIFTETPEFDSKKEEICAKAVVVLKQSMGNFFDSNRRLVDDISNEMKHEFVAKVKEIGAEFKADHSITIKEVDIDGIQEVSRRTAHQNVEVPRDAEGFWECTGKIVTLGLLDYTKIVNKVVHSTYIENLKSSYIKVVTDTVSNDGNLISFQVENFITGFKKSLHSLIASGNKELEKIKNDESTDKEIRIDIASKEQKKKEILSHVRHLNEMLEDLR
jgi:hypothetical protein